MSAVPKLKPRHFTVLIDGIPVRVLHLDGKMPTPETVEAIGDVIRAIRAEREKRRAGGI